MSSTFKNWTSDNYAFVGKAFDFAYADRLNKLSPVVGEVNAKSIDYELTGSGGYGEAPRYDGENLNEGSLKRGFKTVITPVEYTLSIPVGYKEAKVDKMGETKKVGTKLGDSMALTVYLHVLRMFANAWNTDGKHNGGDGVSWPTPRTLSPPAAPRAERLWPIPTPVHTRTSPRTPSPFPPSRRRRLVPTDFSRPTVCRSCVTLTRCSLRRSLKKRRRRCSARTPV